MGGTKAVQPSNLCSSLLRRPGLPEKMPKLDEVSNKRPLPLSPPNGERVGVRGLNCRSFCSAFSSIEHLPFNCLCLLIPALSSCGGGEGEVPRAPRFSCQMGKLRSHNPFSPFKYAKISSGNSSLYPPSSRLNFVASSFRISWPSQ